MNTEAAGPSLWDSPDTRELVARALEEDIGAGDLTSLACVPEQERTRGCFLAKQDLVVAGIELLPVLYNLRRDSPGLEFISLKRLSGSRARKGEPLAELAGPARLVLERERVALNFLGHLSGIATMTRRFVDAVAGTGAAILDTRKTTPGLRHLEKLAVAAGGGTNHRRGLYDGVLIKENHVMVAGGIRKALEAARGRVPAGIEVEIEVRNLEELREALEAGAKSVLLDNFTPSIVSQAVALAKGRARLEVSGGVTLENVRAYAEAGPDSISVGALTHSAAAADITFLLQNP